MTGAPQDLPVRLLAYGLMPNHWHLAAWPNGDDDLSLFTGRPTLTHTRRSHAHDQNVGPELLYQGRF